MKNIFKIGFAGLCLLFLAASCKEREEKLTALKKQERSSKIRDDLKEQTSLRIKVFDRIPTYYDDMWSREIPYDTVIYSYRRIWNPLGDYDYDLEANNYTLDSLRKDGFVKIGFVKNNVYLIFREHSDTWKILAKGGWTWDMDIQSSKAKIPLDAIKGDFNGDGIVDYVWSEVFWDDPRYDCMSGETVFRFSGNFPTLSFDGYIGGLIDNLGDLDNDGADELGFFPIWPTSVFHYYDVYSFKGKAWKCILSIPYNKNFLGMYDTQSRYQAHAYLPPVAKHKTKKGYIIVKSNGWGEDDEGCPYWYLKTDTIKLKLK
jgi:hypothetical protein